MKFPGLIETSLDSKLQTPRNYVWSLTFERELPKGGLVEERSLHSYTELGWKKRVSFVLGIPVERMYALAWGMGIASVALAAIGAPLIVHARRKWLEAELA